MAERTVVLVELEGQSVSWEEPAQGVLRIPAAGESRLFRSVEVALVRADAGLTEMELAVLLPKYQLDGNFALARGEEGRYPFTLRIPSGITPGAALEVDARVVDIRDRSAGVRRPLHVKAPPHQRNVFRLLAEELGTPVSRYRPVWLGSGLMAVYKPTGDLCQVFDEVCLEIFRHPSHLIGELTLNLAERKALDYLRAAVGKDRIKHTVEFKPEEAEKFRTELRELLRPHLARVQPMAETGGSTP